MFFSCAMGLRKNNSSKRLDLSFHNIFSGKFTSKPRLRVLDPVSQARVQTYRMRAFQANEPKPECGLEGARGQSSHCRLQLFVIVFVSFENVP